MKIQTCPCSPPCPPPVPQNLLKQKATPKPIDLGAAFCSITML